MIPERLLPRIGDALRAHGDHTPILKAVSLAGGAGGHAFRFATEERHYFLKWNDRGAPGLYTSEAQSLALLRKVAGARVPEVVGTEDPREGEPGFMIQRWVDARPRDAYAWLGASFGEALAALHRTSLVHAPHAYGLDGDNAIGWQPQCNGWHEDWVAFFRERRLAPQVELADGAGRLTPARRRKLNRLMDRLDEWLGGVVREPVLVHGDLWMGNVLFTKGSEELVLIDPAAYWGDREVDLAAVEVYDPAPTGFLEAYSAAWPLPPGRTMRRDLYNLYLMLSSLNNGARYERRVDETLRRYMG